MKKNQSIRRGVPPAFLSAVTLVTASLLIPSAALAHRNDDGSAGAGNTAAHDHGGRVPDQPDVRRIGDTTYRFNKARGDYEILEPGKPTAYTHPDPPPLVRGKHASKQNPRDQGGWVQLPTSESSPHCRSSGNRIVVVYTHRPSDGTPTPTGTIRSIIRRMNWKIADQSSQSSGGSRVLKMAVDCSGSTINVYNVATSSGSLGVIADTLEDQLGEPTYTNSVRYLAFDNDQNFNAGGQGQLWFDTTKSILNVNVYYTRTAVVWNNTPPEFGGVNWTSHTTIHELFHTLGAVQGGSETPPPYATGAGHCTDGIDVLCYDDNSSGSGSYSETRCPASKGYETPAGVPLDCGRDTYFDAAPSGGSWLAEHWNVGEPEDPFLVAPPKATTLSATDFSPGEATLRGTVYPEGTTTSYYFEYDTSPYSGEATHGTKVPVPSGSVSNLTTEYTVTQPISGLKSTTYYFRLVATNDVGTAYGASKSFVKDWTPSIQNLNPDVSFREATLDAEIHPKGLSTEYYFEWATEEEINDLADELEEKEEYEKIENGEIFTNKTPLGPVGSTEGWQEGWIAVSETLEDLNPRDTYLYRFVAENAQGKTKGLIQTFWTGTSGFESFKEGTETGVYPVNVLLQGSGKDTFELGAGGVMSCDVPSGDDYFDEASELITTSGTYDRDCVGGSQMEMNGCGYTFRPALEEGSQYRGYIDIGGPSCSAIALHPSAKCEILIPPQTGLEATYEGIGGSPAEVGVKMDAERLLFEIVEPTESACFSWPVGRHVGFSWETPEGSYWALSSHIVEGLGWESTDLKLTSEMPYAPIATTGGAEYLGSGKEKLFGSVDPGFLATEYRFEYGLDTEYGSATEWTSGSGEVEALLEGLKAKTTYHYRVVAKNDEGTTEGDDATFKTTAIPPRFDAESHPVTITGAETEQLEVSMVPGTLKCEGASLEGEAGDPSKRLDLETALSGCELGGEEPTIAMNSCHFELGVLESEPPTYEGNLGIGCTEEGDAIVIESEAGIGGICTITYSPQEGSEEGVSLENFGEEAERGIKTGFDKAPLTAKYEGGFFACGTTEGKEGTTNLSGAIALAGADGEEAVGVFVVGSLPELLEAMPATEFDGDIGSYERFESLWLEPGWAANKGQMTRWAWAPHSGSVTPSGAYYDPPLSDEGWGLAVAATLLVKHPSCGCPPLPGDHFSLWLDMPAPAEAERAGYELRLTRLSAEDTYSVALSKWVGGEETVLGSKASYTFKEGHSLALVDEGATVSAWTDTGSGYEQLLSAEDSTYAGGKAGLSGTGTNAELQDFKATALTPPKATTEAASEVKQTSATLNGEVNPEGLATEYRFQWASDAEFEAEGYAHTTTAKEAGSGTEYVAASDGLEGLEAGITYHYRTVAESEAGTVWGKDRTLKTEATSGPGAVALVEPFDGSAESIERFETEWTALGWAEGSTPKGEDAEASSVSAGWRPVDIGILNGAYHSATLEDKGEGLAVAATMAVDSLFIGHNISLWLDMPTPGGVKAGYELRFTVLFSEPYYEVTLSKWVGGEETVLASETGYTFEEGDGFALADEGGTVAALTDTGSGFKGLLSAEDATFAGGKAGLSAAGKLTRLVDFRAGGL